MHLTEILSLERQLTLYDLETTGKETDSARIVEFSMYVYRPGILLPERYWTLVEPGIEIPPEVAGKHGITNELLTYACAKCKAPAESHPHDGCQEWKPVPRWADLAPRVYAGFSESDFAGFNIFYDLKVTQAEMLRCGLSFDYSKAYVLDAKRIWQILEPRTLSDAVEYFAGRKHEGAHGALADVAGTEEVLIGQFTNHAQSDKLPRTMKELHELCFPRDPSWIDSEGKFVWINGKACFNFGKLQGRPVTSDIGYLQWMLRGGFSVEVKSLINQWMTGNWPVQTAQGDLPL